MVVISCTCGNRTRTIHLSHLSPRPSSSKQYAVRAVTENLISREPCAAPGFAHVVRKAVLTSQYSTVLLERSHTCSFKIFNFIAVLLTGVALLVLRHHLYFLVCSHHLAATTSLSAKSRTVLEQEEDV